MGALRILQLAQRKRGAFPTAFDPTTADRNTARSAHGHGLRVDVDDAGGVLVDAQDQHIIRQHRFEGT
ncbi:MAG: hypothetical protein E6J51_10365 [Chloroflexi bacterium]|nr:MAG: hypothetical protein E6J51_10365 [Chloroflexota bacterium]